MGLRLLILQRLRVATLVTALGMALPSGQCSWLGRKDAGDSGMAPVTCWTVGCAQKGFLAAQTLTRTASPSALHGDMSQVTVLSVLCPKTGK